MWRLCCKGFNKGNYENQKGFRANAHDFWFPLRCTLEELYKGVERSISLDREHTVPDKRGEITSAVDSKTLVVNIPPGSQHGNQIVFPRLGSVEAGKMPGDLIFVVEQEPHAVFERIGDDLWAVKKIPLMEYLTIDTVNIETLDGRSFTVLKTRPGCITEILNEGMPIRHLGMKGSLFIRLEVVFPKNLSLTDEERNQLKKLLSKEIDQPVHGSTSA